MPRKPITLPAEIYSQERIASSVNGNPRFIFHTSEGSYRLQSDAGYGYEAENHPTPRQAVLILTPARRVTHIEEIAIPADHPVRSLTRWATATDPVTCGTCHRRWDDAIVTGSTPAPAGRCPFEVWHIEA